MRELINSDFVQVAIGVVSLVIAAVSVWIGLRQTKALRDETGDRSVMSSVLSLNWDEPDPERARQDVAESIRRHEAKRVAVGGRSRH